MWPTYLKSTAVPVVKNWNTKMWQQICNVACFEGFITHWDFKCFLSFFSMIDTWHHKQVYHKHSSVMKQQSNKVTEPSQGSVMTVIDYLAFAAFKASEVPCSTDKKCSKWQLLAGRKLHSVYLRVSGPNTNWTVCLHHRAFICSPPSATRLNTNV